MPPKNNFDLSPVVSLYQILQKCQKDIVFDLEKLVDIPREFAFVYALSSATFP